MGITLGVLAVAVLLAFRLDPLVFRHSTEINYGSPLLAAEDAMLAIREFSTSTGRAATKSASVNDLTNYGLSEAFVPHISLYRASETSVLDPKTVILIAYPSTLLDETRRANYVGLESGRVAIVPSEAAVLGQICTNEIYIRK
jgi:hypothetical protein